MEVVVRTAIIIMCQPTATAVGIVNSIGKIKEANHQLGRANHHLNRRYSLSLICQPDIRGHETPHHHHLNRHFVYIVQSPYTIKTRNVPHYPRKTGTIFIRLK